jgi:hypothetical protein
METPATLICDQCGALANVGMVSSQRDGKSRMVNARGNRVDIDTQFSPRLERLAFAIQLPEEMKFAELLPDQLECVTAALRESET